jgi:alpha-tubulin suppressor-like RCC1 family protein
LLILHAAEPWLVYELPRGALAFRRGPVLPAVEVRAVACGREHAVVLGRDGRLVGWGGNSHGQLADALPPFGPAPDPRAAVPVSGAVVVALLGVRVARVACGHWHTLVVDGPSCHAEIFSWSCSDLDVAVEDGNVFGFGDGRLGQLGPDARSHAHPIPVRIPMSEKAVSVSCGATHSAVLTEQGRVAVWGGGAGDEFAQAVHVPDLNEVVQLSVCDDKCSAVTVDAKCFEWSCTERPFRVQVPSGSDRHRIVSSTPGVWIAGAFSE